MATVKMLECSFDPAPAFQFDDSELTDLPVDEPHTWLWAVVGLACWHCAVWASWRWPAAVFGWPGAAVNNSAELSAQRSAH